MPALKPEYEALAKAVNGRLRGDPSLPLDEEPEEEPPAEDDEEVGMLPIPLTLTSPLTLKVSLNATLILT